VAAPAWLRRVRRSFGISAPRMDVRTPLPWWGRVTIFAILGAIIVGIWWWGYDFGQFHFFGGFNRKEVEAQLASLNAESVRLRSETSELRARNTQLESDLGMTRGAQEALSKQASDLAGENAQLKEELAFLQKLFADSNSKLGLTISRLTAERASDDAWHYSVLIVRGGVSGNDEFQGRLVLTAQLAGGDPPGSGPKTVTLPDDQPASEPALRLKFKYYQRLEGSFQVPPGSRLTALTARAYEAGSPSPRTSKTLNNP
jgi:hypothetical protein